MNIIFFGTPDFAIPSLEILLKSNHKIQAVVTAEDKQRGRGKEVTFTAIKKFALDYKLTVLQPSSLKDDDFYENLKMFQPDLFVVVAFKILPRKIFELPKFGSINLHASLLPKYRGAAPIHWAIINGDDKTGVTTFALKEKVDTGNIILQKEIKISPKSNFEIIHDELSQVGAKIVLETVDQLESGTVKYKEQDSNLATPAPKITKDLCRINWDDKAQNIKNKIRAFSPYPGAFFEHKELIYKIYNCNTIEKNELSAGEIIQDKDNLIVGCKDGAIQITEIQLQGRKRMTVVEFLRGHSLI